MAGKALVSRFKHSESRTERQEGRKTLARNMFKRAAVADYEPARIVEPDAGLVVPDTRIVIPDFKMVEA